MIAVDNSIFKEFMIYFRQRILSNNDFFVEILKNIQNELNLSSDQISVYMQPAIHMADYNYNIPVFCIDNSKLLEEEAIQKISKAISLSINNNIRKILTIIDNENKFLTIMVADLYKDIIIQLSDNIIQSSRLFMVHKFALEGRDTIIVRF